MELLITAAVVICIGALCYFIGTKVALHKYATRMLDEAYAGDLVIDLRDLDDTVKFRFEKSPKEMLEFDYVLVKIEIQQ